MEYEQNSDSAESEKEAYLIPSTTRSSLVVEDEFSKLKAEIEGLSSVIKKEEPIGHNLEPNEYNTAESTFVYKDSEIMSRSKKPMLPQEPPVPSPELPLEIPENAKSSEISTFLMQWVRKLFDEKAELEKTVQKLREKAKTRIDQEQDVLKKNEELRIKNGIMEKRIADLENQIKEAEISKRSLEKSLELSLQNPKNIHSIENNEISEKSNNIEISVLKEKIQLLNEKLNLMDYKHKMQSARIGKNLLEFSAKLNEKISILFQNIDTKFAKIVKNMNKMHAKLKNIPAKLNSAKIAQFKGFLEKLKSVKLEINEIKKNLYEKGYVKTKIMPFYRIF